ncbi:nucleotidyltransferase family protein [Candidatus Daviesbacteria bacterium]|nr:nucleotidyltransferase family protein [Candidatus Daviesbacteria bacterium]
MEAEDVIELYTLFEENHIEVWIDGGWGIDALLGKQTRPHKDLDIAINHKDKPKLRRLLAEKGYKDIDRDDTSDWNFVLGDGEREIDVHTFVFDDKGKNIYGTAYPKQSLTGSGMINGKSVKCIPPEWVVKFHAEAKYIPKEKDIQDVKAICDKFGLKLPEKYKKS